MKRLTILLPAVFLLSGIAAYAAENATWGRVKAELTGDAKALAQLAAKPVTTNLKIPAAGFTFPATPCGSFQVLGGSLHLLFQEKSDGTHIFHAQPQGATAIGLDGDIKDVIFRGVGNSQEVFNLGPGQSTTSVDIFHMISPGQAPNLLIHRVLHITYNANGELTAEVDFSRAECKY